MHIMRRYDSVIDSARVANTGLTKVMNGGKKDCTRGVMKERYKLIKKIMYSTLGHQLNDISTEHRDRAKWPIQKGMVREFNIAGHRRNIYK